MVDECLHWKLFTNLDFFFFFLLFSWFGHVTRAAEYYWAMVFFLRVKLSLYDLSK